MTLTPREDEVFRLLLTGRPLIDIAAELQIKISTLHVYARFVYTKKRVKNRLYLMAREIENRQRIRSNPPA